MNYARDFARSQILQHTSQFTRLARPDLFCSSVHQCFLGYDGHHSLDMASPGNPPYPQAASGQPPAQQPPGPGAYPPPYYATSQVSFPQYPGSGAPPMYPPSQPGYPPSNPGYPTNAGAPYPMSGGGPPYPMGGGGAPYPMSGGGAPYPMGGGGAPYPMSGGGAPYPMGGGGAPYPMSGGGAPYPMGGGGAPYPTGGSALPYPSSGTSYPNPSAGAGGGFQYPGGQAASTGYPPQGGGYIPPQELCSTMAPAPGHDHPPVQSQQHESTDSPKKQIDSPKEQIDSPKKPIDSLSHDHDAPKSVVQPKENPTVRPAQGFSARQDAEVLRKAMKGLGTDEKAIIDIITKSSNAQRMEITQQYSMLFGKDLIKMLKSELSGDFEKLVVALMTSKHVFLAQQLNEAFKGFGTDEDSLIEVLCTHPNHEIKAICSTYESSCGRSMEKSLGSETSGDFKGLLVLLCKANRDESATVDKDACERDAQALLKAGKEKTGTDESTFTTILGSRSYAQLRQIFVDYERIAGHDIEKAIKSEFKGDMEAGLVAIVKCARNKASFFAERLHASMSGMGTKDGTLIRVVVTRCEVDMADIKREFQAKYGKSLETFISSDTSGDYKKCLLALVA